MSAAPPRGNWFVRGGWYYVVHVLLAGCLTPWPLTHAALRVRTPWAWGTVATSVAAMVTFFSLAAAAPVDAAGQMTGPLANAASAVLGVHFIVALGVIAVVKGRAFPAPGTEPREDPAVAAALGARRRRAEARDLAARDPLLARELGIGRPDRARTYDDGGLVDLNSVPADAIVRFGGLEPAHAGAIVQARQAAGRFSSVEDVFAWTDPAMLPLHVWDLVRERGVVL